MLSFIRFSALLNVGFSYTTNSHGIIDRDMSRSRPLKQVRPAKVKRRQSGENISFVPVKNAIEQRVNKEKSLP